MILRNRKAFIRESLAYLFVVSMRSHFIVFCIRTFDREAGGYFLPTAHSILFGSLGACWLINTWRDTFGSAKDKRSALNILIAP